MSGYKEFSNLNGTKRTVTAIGEKVKNGKKVNVVGYNNGKADRTSYYLADMSSGFYKLGGIGNDGKEFFWEPEFPYLLASFIPGEIYQYQIWDSSTEKGSVQKRGRIFA